MNFKIPVILFLAVAAISAAAPAQNQPPAAPIVGGYSAASVKDPEVLKATKFALRAQKKSRKPRLLSIESAEKQLVAGMNYRLALKIKSGGKISRASAVVYRDLGGKFALTSWTTTVPAKTAPSK